MNISNQSKRAPISIPPQEESVLFSKKFKSYFGEEIVKIEDISYFSGELMSVLMIKNPKGKTSDPISPKPNDYCYNFRTNVRCSVALRLIGFTKEVGFPPGTVGVQEHAVAVDIATNSEFCVKNYYGLFFLVEKIPQEMIDKYSSKVQNFYREENASRY